MLCAGRSGISIPGALSFFAQRFELLLREREERFADTVPDFFVEEVRLDAAAARFAGFAELRDLEAELLAALLVLRAEDLALLRAADERELAFDAVRDVLRAAVEREVKAFFAVDLAEDFAAVFLAGAFFAAVFLAVVFLAVVFFAVDLALDLADDFVTAFFEAVLFEPVFAALFLAAVERDEVPVAFFAADLRAVEAPDFLAPDLEPLDELRRALPFFAVDLVRVAPVSPVNSFVSGFDFSSIGIAASFKGLRVQPSRLQGNVVIPSGFRLTESVESRTRTISVDTLP